MNVKTLERCFNERVDREMNNIVDTVEDRIQNAILTAIDNIVAPKIELAIRSISASSGRDVTSVSVNSERREHARINASFENASGNNDTQVISKVNDETRHSITEEVSELSVPETHFDRQPHTHHMVKGNGDRHSQTHHKYSYVILSSNLFWSSMSFLFSPSSMRSSLPSSRTRQIFKRIFLQTLLFVITTRIISFFELQFHKGLFISS